MPKLANCSLGGDATFAENLCLKTGFSGGSAVKNTPAMQEPQETRVGSLVWEDPLEEGMTTHSSVLVWEIPWIEEPGRLQSIAISSHLKGLRVGGCRREQIAYYSFSQEA